MLHILKAQEAFSKAKANNGAIFMQPNLFASNFLIKSFDKFGLYDVPAELLSHANTSANIHKIYLKKLDKYFVKSVTRPVFNNKEILINKALETLEKNEDLYCTLTGASLLFKWMKDKDLEFSFEISSSFTTDDLALAYSRVENRDSYPLALERLTKLWFNFYGKKVNKEDTVLVGFLQDNIVNKKYTRIRDGADIFYTIVKNVRDNETAEFSSNNIHNKLLEELYLFSNALKHGEVITGEVDVIQVGEEKINKDKDEYLKLFIETSEEEEESMENENIREFTDEEIAEIESTMELKPVRLNEDGLILICEAVEEIKKIVKEEDNLDLDPLILSLNGDGVVRSLNYEGGNVVGDSLVHYITVGLGKARERVYSPSEKQAIQIIDNIKHHLLKQTQDIHRKSLVAALSKNRNDAIQAIRSGEDADIILKELTKKVKNEIEKIEMFSYLNF